MTGLANSGLKECKGALEYAIEEIEELEAQLADVQNLYHLAGAQCVRETEKVEKLREALLGLNAAMDYHWNDTINVTQRMPDAHAKRIEAAQQIAKQALKDGG